MTMSGSQSIEFVNAALDGAAMRRREPLDSTSFVRALDQGAFSAFLFSTRSGRFGGRLGVRS
jgi:hypothetical protein